MRDSLRDADSIANWATLTQQSDPRNPSLNRGSQRHRGANVAVLIRYAMSWAVVVLLGSQQSVASEDELMALLPDSTRAFVVVDEFPLAWQQLVDHRENGQPNELNINSFADRFGLTGEVIGQHANGALLRAEVLLTSEQSAELFLVDCEQPGQLVELARENLVARGANIETIELFGLNAELCSWSESDGAKRSCVLMSNESCLIATDQRKAAETVAGISTGEVATTLSSQEVFELAWARRPPRGEDTLYSASWFVDFWQREARMLDADSSSLDEDDAYQFALRHGLRGAESIVGRVDITSDRREFATTLVRAPAPRMGSLKMASSFEGTTGWEVPVWLSDSVDNVTVLNANVAEAMQYVGPLFDDAFADGIEGTYQQLLEDLKGEFGLDIDLEADLYAFLGPSVCLIGDADENSDHESLLIGFQIQDEEKVAKALAALMQDDPEAEQVLIRDASHPLWVVKGLEGENDFVLGVAGTWAVYANDLELVEQTVASSAEVSPLVHKLESAYEATLAEIKERSSSAEEQPVGPFMLSLSPEYVGDSTDVKPWRHPLELLFASPDQLQTWLASPTEEASSDAIDWLAGFGGYPLVVGFVEENGWRMIGRRPGTSSQ